MRRGTGKTGAAQLSAILRNFFDGWSIVQDADNARSGVNAHHLKPFQVTCCVSRTLVRAILSENPHLVEKQDSGKRTVERDGSFYLNTVKNCAS